MTPDEEYRHFRVGLALYAAVRPTDELGEPMLPQDFLAYTRQEFVRLATRHAEDVARQCAGLPHGLTGELELTPEDAQAIHERRQERDDDHDLGGCWCCCTDCDEDFSTVVPCRDRQAEIRAAILDKNGVVITPEAEARYVADAEAGDEEPAEPTPALIEAMRRVRDTVVRKE